jgi:hypothetical protein
MTHLRLIYCLIRSSTKSLLLPPTSPMTASQPTSGLPNAIRKSMESYVLYVTAHPSAQFETVPTTRDNHLLMTQSLESLVWQEAYGYGKCALVETTMGCFKAIIGTRLRIRDPRRHQAEVNAAVAVLNRMLSAGCPNSVHFSNCLLSPCGVGVILVPAVSMYQRHGSPQFD